MAIFDFLIDKKGLRKQKNRAIDFAEERYDPAQFQPQVDLARERAVEGVSEGLESQARRRTVESLFRPTDTSIYGGNQARAIAGQQARNRQAQEGMADFESQLTRQDIQTKQRGEQQFAQARSQQKQTAAKRDAAIEEAKMQYQAELEKRRGQIGSVIGNLAGTVAGSFLGPAGAAAGGAIAGGITGGGMGAVQGAGAGFTTSFQRQQSQDFINQLTGGDQQAQTRPDVGELLSDVVRQSNRPQQPQDETIEANIDTPPQPQFGEPMQMPEGQRQPQYDFTGGYQNTPSDFMSEQEQNQLLSVLGYDESGRKIQQQPQPTNQDFIDEDFFEELNFNMKEQTENVSRQRMGSQMFDPPSQFLENIMGPAGRLPFEAATLPFETQMNILDIFGQAYRQGRQQFREEQGVNY